MTTPIWEGDFSWQGYALQGRPDLLNYLHRGDVSWEGVWSLYRARAAPPEAILAVMSLFHAFMSAEYDRQGCWLETEAELYHHLRGWAQFAIESEEVLAEERIQAGLSHLADIGLISAPYYSAAFRVYMEAVLDQHAARWRRGLEAEGRRQKAESSRDRSKAVSDTAASFLLPSAFCLLPSGREAAGRLPIYYPEASRFPELGADPRWENSVRALLAGHYESWNQAYCATLTDDEVEEALREEGGEG